MEGLENVFDSTEDDIFEDDNNATPTEQPVSVEREYEQEREIDSIFEDYEEDNEESGELSAVDKFLQARGFKDSKVKIINDKNEEEEADYHSLSEQDKFDILNSQIHKEKNDQLSEVESEWLEELRSNNLDFNSFLELYKDSIIEELGGNTGESYDIDAYDDKELYLLDQKNKYDLTDEELKKELEKELENEDLFTKKVSRIREEYKALEEHEKQLQEQQFAEKQQKEYHDFANQMVEIARGTGEFHGLELEDDDKNETLSYMLDLDDDGVSQLTRDLADPKKLYEVAWYMKYGKDAFSIIENAYETEIARMKAQRDKPRVVRQDTQSRTGIKHMNEL